MGYRVKYTEQGAADLLEILEYVSEELANPSAAGRFMDEVDKKLEHIGDNPCAYPLSRDEKLKAEGYRVAVVGNYLLFYVLEEAEGIAYIVRILYGKRDVSQAF